MMMMMKDEEEEKERGRRRKRRRKSGRRWLEMGAMSKESEAAELTQRRGCCNSSSSSGDANGKVLAGVQEYYSVVLKKSSDLKTNACTASGAPPSWLRRIMKRIPGEVNEKFYGCGVPLPSGIDGLRVLDLGSGSGRDCYALAAMVGEKGDVVGVDMTQDQIDVAERHASEYCTQELGYSRSNLSFKKGYIEQLKACGLESESFDMIVSNCVINLSPDKEAVLREAYRVLKFGGELHFSDVYCDRRLPASVVNDQEMWGECLSGAMYIEDFMRICQSIGFTDPRTLKVSVITVNNEKIQKKLGEAKFFSITYRLFKMPQGMLETKCEDYGQYAVYKGSIPESENAYQLDDHHR